jgi:hypothetical protein
MNRIARDDRLGAAEESRVIVLTTRVWHNRRTGHGDCSRRRSGCRCQAMGIQSAATVVSLDELAGVLLVSMPSPVRGSSSPKSKRTRQR